MTITKKSFAWAAAIATFFAMTPFAFANPLRFPPAQSTSTATSSPTYLSAGAATTTLATYDTYANTGSPGTGGSSQQMDKVAVMLQHTASTSASVATFTIQYSMDNIDWYDDETSFLPATVSTQNITNPIIYSVTGNTTSSTTLKVIMPNTPLRYVRVRGTVAGTNGGLWVSIQPQKQSN